MKKIEDVIGYHMQRSYGGIGSCVWKSHKWSFLKIATWAIFGEKIQEGTFVRLWYFDDLNNLWPLSTSKIEYMI